MKEMKIRKCFSDELVEHLYVIVADGDYIKIQFCPMCGRRLADD